MKNSLIFILITLICSSIYGQTRLISYPINIPVQDSLEVSLTDIEKSDYTFYFRLLLGGQIVDIYSQDNQTYEGKIINLIK